MSKFSPPGITEEPYWKQKIASEYLYTRPGIESKMGLSMFAKSVHAAEEALEDAKGSLEGTEQHLAISGKHMSETAKAELSLDVSKKKLEVALRKVQHLNTQIKEIQDRAARSTTIEPTGETVSTVLPGVKGKGRKRVTHKRKGGRKWTFSGTRRRN